MIFCLILLLVLLVCLLLVYLNVAKKYLNYKIDEKCSDLDKSTKAFKAIEKLYSNNLIEECVYTDLLGKYMTYIEEEKETLSTLKGSFGVFFAFLV